MADDGGDAEAMLAAHRRRRHRYRRGRRRNSSAMARRPSSSRGSELLQRIADKSRRDRRNRDTRKTHWTTPPPPAAVRPLAWANARNGRRCSSMRGSRPRRHLRELFAADPARGERLVAEAAGLYLDYSKQRVTDETLALLFDAGRCLRPAGAHRGDVPRRARQRHRAAAGAARRAACPGRRTDRGRWRRRGARGPRGAGPDGGRSPNACATATGPASPASASATWSTSASAAPTSGRSWRTRRCAITASATSRCVSCPTSTAPISSRPRATSMPAETLFIVCSKTFTTLETLTNAHAARAWCLRRSATRRRSRGTSSRCPPMPTGVRAVRHRHRQHVRLLGLGRRSLFDGFGDRAVDDDRDRPGALPRHARRLPRDGRRISAARRFDRNLPVLMGLLAIWNNDFLGAATVAVLPYAQYLKRFPAYLQQLTMESNGKHVTVDGAPVDYQTGPDLLGRAGHQRPAFVLPADPPGHAAGAVRFHRLLPAARTRWASTARPADGQPVRPGRSAGVRQDRGRRCGPKARRAGMVAASHVRRQPAEQHDPRRRASRRTASARWSRSTNTACSCRASIWNID